MRKIFSIIFITIFFSCNKSENLKKTKQNDVQKNHLKGNVKILEEKNFDATEKFGEPVKLNFEIGLFQLLILQAI